MLLSAGHLAHKTSSTLTSIPLRFVICDTINKFRVSAAGSSAAFQSHWKENHFSGWYVMLVPITVTALPKA
jgi:hypothetical protein